MVKQMKKTNNFSWILNDIDQTLIFMIRDASGMLGSYQVGELRINGVDPVNVKAANIMDLTNFVNFATVRFVNSLNNQDIVDIPIKKLSLLYDACAEITEGVPRKVTLAELETFAVYDNKVIRDGYYIYGYKIGELSKELDLILKASSNFNSFDMNTKLGVLKEINTVAFERENSSKKGKK